MDLARIDFQQLRIKHIFFKSKVRAVLFGSSYDAGFFGDLNPVNKWFETVGKASYIHEPELNKLIGLHQNFKRLALELFSIYESGRIEQAHAGMAAVNELSDNFLSILTQLETRITNN